MEYVCGCRQGSSAERTQRHKYVRQLYVAGVQERRAIYGALSREVARMHRAAMTSQPRAQDAAAPKQWQAWDQAFAQVWCRQLSWHKRTSRQQFAWQQPCPSTTLP